MMPILVKSDDVRSGRKAKGRHGPLWRLGSQWVKEMIFRMEMPFLSNYSSLPKETPELKFRLRFFFRSATVCNSLINTRARRFY